MNNSLHPLRVLLLLLPALVQQSLAAEGAPTVSAPILDPPSVSLGANLTISVRVQSTTPCTYQWQFKGANLDPAAEPSAAQPILKLSDITLTQEGPYRVIVSNGSGSTTSAEAVLDVDPTFTVVRTSFSGNPPAWGGSWADYDGDGDPDLLLGHFSVTTDRPLQLHRNNGDGTFGALTPSEAGPLMAFATLYGTYTWADYDNNGNANHWLKVRLEGRASNREGIGAKVRVRATLKGKPVWQLREITGGDNSWSSLPEAHFGLGDATVLDTVRIEWPSGLVQELTGIAPNQTIRVVETQAAADKGSRRRSVV